jgi:membrane protein implicated in regulation of membrane protease activity
MIEALLLFTAAVAVFAIGGVVVGMLVAPRLDRMTNKDDEDDGDGED